MQQAERIKGAIWGLLIGDALGVPYEFHPPNQIPALDQIEMQPPSGFRRAHSNVPVGTWSDDGAQALALLDSLLDRGRLDLDDFAQRLVDWYERDHYAVDRVFDVGVQTSQAIRALMAGVSAHKAGPNHSQANGNGSLMRVLPLALWHLGSDSELVHDAHRQSLVTHGHARSQVCCALYCLWARAMLEERSQPWQTAVSKLRQIYQDQPSFQEELEWQIRPDLEPEGKGSGYVVDSLRSARLVLEQDTYERVVRHAIALGHDTDTTACIAGGLAGLRDGFLMIPERWYAALRGKELVETLVQRLLEHRAKPSR
jgi:ADP-ribosyl-[dinitrogen reductase] hydrolase